MNKKILLFRKIDNNLKTLKMIITLKMNKILNNIIIINFIKIIKNLNYKKWMVWNLIINKNIINKKLIKIYIKNMIIKYRESSIINFIKKKTINLIKNKKIINLIMIKNRNKR